MSFHCSCTSGARVTGKDEASGVVLDSFKGGGKQVVRVRIPDTGDIFKRVDLRIIL